MTKATTPPQRTLPPSAAQKRVFISHNNGDDAFVDQLVDDLHRHGIPTFSDHHNIRGAARWNEHVQEALEDCQQMVAVVSERSLASKNCQDEWHVFMNEHKELIPLWLSGDKMYFGFSTAIRVDFRNPADYAKNLQALITLLTDDTIQFISDPTPGARKVPPQTAMGALSPALADLYPLVRRPDKFIGIATGNIGKIGGADVLVNSENDYLDMDRPTGKTISGALNAWSAQYDERGRLIFETVKEELKKIGAELELPLAPASVVVTSAGNLVEHNVRCILHAVSVIRDHDRFSPASRLQLERCVTHTLARIDVLNRTDYAEQPLRWVVIPLFGAGEGGIPLTEVAPLLIERAIDHLELQDTAVEKVYFLAYQAAEYAQLKTILGAIPDLDAPINKTSV